MLDLIRKKQQTALVKVVFWVIIATFIGTIFLVWGKGRDQQQNMTVAAQVNGDDITFEDFRTTYSNMYNLYRNLYGQNFTPELEKQLQLTRQSINLLVDRQLLLQEADRMHLSISKDELIQAIAEVPEFQVDGVFNKEKYLQVLSYQRLVPEVFEQMQQQQMLVNLTQAQLRSEAVVGDADVADEFRRLNEKINLSYVAFKAGDFTGAVQVTDEALSAFYADNQEQFRVPDMAALNLVIVEPATYMDQVTCADEDIQRYYDRHMSEYAIPEQVSAAHILIAVDADASDEQRAAQRALAEKVLEEAQTGDFAKLAKKYSADTATASKGGELGLFQRGVMDPAFESAAFALEKDALSPVVESRFGFHIIKGGEHIEAGFTPLTQVRGTVEAALRREEAGKLAYEKAMDAYNLNRKDGTFVAAAESLGLTPMDTGLFSRSDAIPMVGLNPDLMQKAFAGEAGSMLAPVKTSQGVILAEVREKVVSTIPELAAVKDRVAEAYKREQAVVLAEQAAQQALEKVQGGAALKTVLGSGQTVAETGLFSRALGEFVPSLGNVPGLAEAAFKLTIKDPVPPSLFSATDTFYVVRLKQLQPADPNGLTAEESERLQQTVLARKQDELLRNKLDELKQTADVTINPAILRSMEGNES